MRPGRCATATPCTTLAPVSAATVTRRGPAQQLLRARPAGRGARRRARRSADPTATASSNAWVTSSAGSPSSRSAPASSSRTCTAGDRIERGERLVEQQHLRLARERSRERDALALATGELRRAGVGEVRDAEALEQVGAVAPRGEAHVGGGREVREQAVVLRHVADAALLRQQANAPRGVQPELPVQRDPAAVGTLEPGHRAQQRALAGARAPEHGDRLVGEAEARRAARTRAALARCQRRAGP